jgi:hypothetical protein
MEYITILEKDEYKITKNKKDHNIFNIFFCNSSNSEKLIKSFVKTKIITGATITNNYTLVTFNAKTIKTLNQFEQDLWIKNKTKELPFSKTLKMTYQLSNQLKYMIENYKQSFLGYIKENVIVIDDNNFLYLPTNNELYNIDSEDNIIITSPFNSKDFYLSPEMSTIKEIPSYVHYKCVYFSLGCLLIDCLRVQGQEQRQKQEQEQNTIILYPNILLDNLSLKETKIYYFIKRTLSGDPKNRFLLYI